MSRSRQRTKGRTDTDKSFAGIPRRVMDNPDYKNLSGNAVKLLLELARQYKGERIANNGDLTAAWGVLKERGFNSKKTISRAVQELLNARMIVQTRSGRFINPGGRCSLYALSWLPINECPGKDLEVQSTITPPENSAWKTTKYPDHKMVLVRSINGGDRGYEMKMAHSHRSINEVDGWMLLRPQNGPLYIYTI